MNLKAYNSVSRTLVQVASPFPLLKTHSFHTLEDLVHYNSFQIPLNVAVNFPLKHFCQFDPRDILFLME